MEIALRTPHTFIALAGALFLTACAATTTTIDSGFVESEFKGKTFSNILVIGVADDYDMRAQFERTVAAEIRKSGAKATPYYTVIGNNPPVTASDVQNAVRSRGFDAVLFTRVKGSADQQVKVKDAPGSAAATVKGGNVFDLFRYDYEEFDEPENVRVSTDVTLLTELYSAAEQKRIWIAQSSSYDRESPQQIVDSEARVIVKALNKDDLIGPE